MFDRFKIKFQREKRLFTPFFSKQYIIIEIIILQKMETFKRNFKQTLLDILKGKYTEVFLIDF